jgi:hypothetical protein
MSKAHELRAALFNRKLQEMPYDDPIPGLEEYTGQFSVVELTGTQTTKANKLAQDENGKADPIFAQAATVCMGLIERETKERIFSDTDFEMVAGFGLSVLKPIGDLIGQISGLDQKGLEETKKNYQKRHAKGSNSSSIENSEQQQAG